MRMLSLRMFPKSGSAFSKPGKFTYIKSIWIKKKNESNAPHFKQIISP